MVEAEPPEARAAAAPEREGTEAMAGAPGAVGSTAGAVVAAGARRGRVVGAPPVRRSMRAARRTPGKPTRRRGLAPRPRASLTAMGAQAATRCSSIHKTAAAQRSAAAPTTPAAP